MVLGSAFDILSSCWPPRTAFVNYPLGHSAGKPFDKSDQNLLVRTALEGFMTHTKPGEVNVLDCDWGDMEDVCATVGGAETILRRETRITYQNQEDLNLAIKRHGVDIADGVVSAPAVRQREVLGY